jgi:hypothetical protein
VLVLLFIMALVAGLLAIAGCGDDKTTVKTPFGDVEVSEEDGEFTIEGEEDSVTFETEEGDYTYEGSEKPPTEAELGVAVYPDADYVQGSGVTGTATTPEGQITTATAEFTTSDSFDDVVSFYEGELGQPLYISTSAGEANWTADMGDGSFLSVNVTTDGGETGIIIVRTSM